MSLLDLWESVITVIILVRSPVVDVTCDELIVAEGDAGSGTEGRANGSLTTHSPSLSFERGLRLEPGLSARGSLLLLRLSSRLVLLLLFRF